jgi:hypothetical protein
MIKAIPVAISARHAGSDVDIFFSLPPVGQPWIDHL